MRLRADHPRQPCEVATTKAAAATNPINGHGRQPAMNGARTSVPPAMHAAATANLRISNIGRIYAPRVSLTVGLQILLVTTGLCLFEAVGFLRSIGQR